MYIENSQNIKTEIRFHSPLFWYLCDILFHSRPFPCIFSVFISTPVYLSLSGLSYISQTSSIPLPICERHPNRLRSITSHSSTYERSTRRNVTRYPSSIVNERLSEGFPNSVSSFNVCSGQSDGRFFTREKHLRNELARCRSRGFVDSVVKCLRLVKNDTTMCYQGNSSRCEHTWLHEKVVTRHTQPTIQNEH